MADLNITINLFDIRESFVSLPCQLKSSFIKWCQAPFWAESNSNQLQVPLQGDPRSRVYEKRGHPIGWGESKTGSKKHLRSVSLALLSMAPCTSIHSVLRLGGVQQHLSRLCWGWSGAPLPWDWRWRAAGWPSRQLYLRQRGVTINLATRRNMMNRLYLDSCQKINWCYQKIKHIHIGLKNPTHLMPLEMGKFKIMKGLTSAM